MVDSIYSNCPICGQSTIDLQNCTSNINSRSRRKLFYLWNKDCVNTLVKTIFGNDNDLPLIDYFRKLSLCNSCQQIARDINFTLRRIQCLQDQLEILSNKMFGIIDRNYDEIQEKSNNEAVADRISLLKSDSSSIYRFTQHETLEIIYKVASQNRKSNDGNRHLKTTDSYKTEIDYDRLSDEENFEEIEASTESSQQEVKIEQGEVDFDEFNATDSEMCTEEHNEANSCNPLNGVQGRQSEERSRKSDVQKSRKYDVLKLTTCKICNKSLSSPSKLKRHEATHKTESSRKILKKPQTKYQCATCKESFPKNAALMRHLPIHSTEVNFKCSICGKGFFDAYNCKKHFETHGKQGKPFMCRYCPKAFKERRDTLRHESSHNKREVKKSQKFGKIESNYNYFCKYCGMGYLTEDELNLHYSNSHLGPNPFSCAFCSEIFSNSSNLNNHMKKDHPSPEDVKTFICEVCSKSFKKKQSLLAHLKLHGDPSLLYRCKECSKVFTREAVYERHLETHSTEIKFVCETCGKGFRYQLAYKSHLKCHDKKVKCSICDKLFTNRLLCTNHERSHSNLKEFKCKFCGKAFNREFNLSEHEKRHTGEYIARKKKNNKNGTHDCQDNSISA